MQQQYPQETIKTSVTWMRPSGTSIFCGPVVQVISLLLTSYLPFDLLGDRRAGLSLAGQKLPLTHLEMDRLLKRVGDTIGVTIHGTLIFAPRRAVWYYGGWGTCPTASSFTDLNKTQKE